MTARSPFRVGLTRDFLKPDGTIGFGDIGLVAVSCLIGLVGFIGLATSTSFAMSIVAFAVTGCGLALIFPCMFSVAAHLVPEARASALGLASAVSEPSWRC